MKTFAIVLAIFFAAEAFAQDIRRLKILGEEAFAPPSQEQISQSIQQIENFIKRIESAKIDRKAKDPSTEEAKSIERLVFSSRIAQKNMLDQQKNAILKIKRDVWNQVPWTIPRLRANSLEVGEAGYLTPWWKDTGKKISGTVPSIRSGSAESAEYMAELRELLEEAKKTSCEVRVIERLPNGAITCSAGDYVVMIYGQKPTQASTNDTVTITEPLFVKNVITINNVQIPELHPLDLKIVDQIKAEAQKIAIQKKLREWKSADKKFSIQASLISLEDKKVTLQKTDGTQIELDLNQLSKADRDYCIANLGINP